MSSFITIPLLILEICLVGYFKAVPLPHYCPAPYKVHIFETYIPYPLSMPNFSQF
jgi:hypothetical protein